MKNKISPNAARSEQYRSIFQSYAPLFRDEYRKDSSKISLPYGYTIVKTNYVGEVDNLNLDGDVSMLIDNDGRFVHTWQCVDNNADFIKLITHQNGNRYLIYRQDLYGYSVLDIDHRLEFQYYPQCVLDGSESFIWTDIHYNPSNNIIAVDGCIWGAPYSVSLFDFTAPMSDPLYEIDIIDFLDEGYDKYDDAQFVAWDGNDMRLECYNNEENIQKKIVISSEIYYPLIHVNNIS